ncbi:aldo/keto reductase [Tumebacillus avium]|uniref:aldo/keto reductase n=1 Tax=Tumebacillus avium TaxID=1903704 RepID=UPI0018DF5954|nr:aldo/keto reductase [Tumebacillus avium]
MPVAWSPLAQGQILQEQALQTIAEHHNKSVAQIVLRWQFQTGWATIPKSIRPERIQSNADLFDFTLTDEEITTINTLDQHKRVGPDPDNFNF